MLTRRSLFGLPLAASVGLLVGGQDDHKKGPRLGFHVADWDTSKNSDPQLWERAVVDLHSIGIRRVNLVTCGYVDPKTGRVARRSNHGFPVGATNAALTRALQAANSLNVDAAIYPLLEIDRGTEPGETWRGELAFDDDTLRSFFSSYSTYILRDGVAGQPAWV